ncbi:MAG: fibrinogen-like YCDxxxxGGGW domain-containing protein [Myxococcota bacterium]
MRRLLALMVVLSACGDDDRAPAMDDMGMDAPEMGMVDGGMEMTTEEVGVSPEMGVDGGPAEMGMGDMRMDAPDLRVEPGCDNERQDGTETDVDCGGDVCEARCTAGLDCVFGTDCTSGICISECQPARCTDGIRNGDELGPDCGGSCPGCPLGSPCVEPSDCDAEGSCREGFCQTAACFDEIRNGGESDIDCGGSDCAPCEAGLRCGRSLDCASGTCTGGFCLTETCLNEVLDPGEVEVDCGGGGCPGCPDGTTCGDGPECLSRRCEDDICASCSDGMMTGDETAVDCGGASCAGCATGEACALDRDCASNNCDEDGSCAAGERSCLDILIADSEATSGTYLIQPSETEPARLVYCDMETDGGGWTLVASTLNDRLDDFATPYYDDLATLMPSSGNDGVWGGLRALELPRMDIRFACRRPGSSTNDVDLSFYGNDWYDEITSSTDPDDTCFADGSSNTNGMDPSPERQNNLTGERLQQGAAWLDSSGFEGEDSCGDDGDFTVDFNAGGLDQTDPTDWGNDDSTGQCGSTTSTGVWLIFVRAALCSNGELDAGEVDVDCGGTCGGCPDGTACTMPSDCASERCDGDTCTSCLDGTQNGDEIAVDCGGSCDGCPGGTTCTLPEECASMECDAGTCTALTQFYSEDFEGSDGGWTAAGSLWEWGTPANGVLAGANSGTGAWATGLTRDYENGDNDSVTSPPFDLGSATFDPILSMAVNFNTEIIGTTIFDEGFVEVSIDGGTTFERVEESTGSVGWYPSSAPGFGGSSGGWINVSTTLAGTAGERDVRLRFVFSADTISGTEEGVAFDDVLVAPASPDLQVEVVPSPVLCNAALVRVTNVGTGGLTNFDLEVVVDGGAPMSETVTGLLAPGETFERSVAGGVVAATATALADLNADNNDDSLTLNAPLGGMYRELFEDGPGDWQTFGLNSSWEYGVPSDTAISTADSPVNAWVTNLDGDHNNDEMSFFVSPCFDFSGAATDPTFSFSQIFRLNSTGDRVFMEITTDGGMNWARLGAVGSGENWYNDINDWWDSDSSPTDGIWRRASHPMTGAAGQSGVRVRLVMQTDASGTREGFGVDDVLIIP